MNRAFTVLVCIIAALQTANVDALECYTCSNVSSVASCNTVSLCPRGWVCHENYTTVGTTRLFTLGCMNPTSCQTWSAGTLVGRAVAKGTCSECCHTGMCNRQMCQNDYPNCVDVQNDCTAAGFHTNICNNTASAKNTCKRFCGLCGFADGSWSQWTTWSICTVTCANGTRARTRTCTNPAPINGGKYCDGDSTEQEPCVTGIGCPVPGGWSHWSGWDGCSANCDIATSRRTRRCSNPAPSYGGDSCHGYSWDTRICYLQACQDGHWSAWSGWLPCTVSCGGGVTTQSRTCTNPAPSVTGKYCDGNNMQAASCNINQCVATTVAFEAHKVINMPSIGDRLVYSTTVINIGNGYNEANGIFTAPVHGTYQFSVQICVHVREGLGVSIEAHGRVIAKVVASDQTTTGTCTTGSGIALLNKGDNAWVTFAMGLLYGLKQDNFMWNSFSGVLIGM